MRTFIGLLALSGTAQGFSVPTASTSMTRRTHAASPSSIFAAERVMLDPTVLDKYKALEVEGVVAEYLWVDAVGGVRSKARTLTGKQIGAGPEGLPNWNYDGSSTDQAPGDDSEVLIKPRAVFKDPFRGGKNIMVVCDTYTPAGEPLPTNTRAPAAATFDKYPDEVPWFGLEQEYTLFNLDKKTPLGWPVGGQPEAQGPYYCGAGADRSYGRSVCDAHYQACLFAGITISGTNAEVMPGQWEFQVGPCVGIDAGDHMIAARYLLDRVCEDFGVWSTLFPKPITDGDWNGAGCHTNFSTEKMREDGGYEEILRAIRCLGGAHEKHIAAYGEGNELRLTGKFETASMESFSYGIANRGCSVRIPRATEADNCGYFEDRRPSSNCDPYLVTGMIMDTCMEGEEAEIEATNVAAA